MSHGLHQDHRDSFALAGHDDQVGVAVIAGKVGARNMADQANTALQSQRRYLFLESLALGAIAGDPAEQIEALVAKGGAGVDEKGIVLDFVKTSDGEKAETAVVGLDGRGGGRHRQDAIDSEPLYEDFLRRS